MAEQYQYPPHQPYPRLRSSLHIPDDDAWRQRRNYIPALADALRYVYFLLHSAAEQEDVYFQAYAALVPFRTRILCHEQRLRLDYALALAYAGEQSPTQALDAIRRALEAAEELQDESTLVELAFLAGALAHGAQQHELAFGHYTDALDMLRHLNRDGVAADPMLEMDLTLRLGWRACDIGRFSQGLRYLDEAYTLRTQWPSTNPSHAAWLSWLDAQLTYVVRANPARALAMARPAARLLLEIEQPLNAGRAHTFMAECAIELARTSSAQEDPQAALNIARDATKQAGLLARKASDAIGGEIARLAALQMARVERARRGDSDSINQMATLERALRTAEKLDDMALIGRVETAMGDELAAHGDWSTARLMYAQARSRLEEHNLGGLAFWPRRAMRQMEEP